MFSLAVAIAASITVPPRVTLESLLDDMVDRNSVARTAAPAFMLLQASSYDRAQTDPNDPQTWFANRDCDQFIRTEERGGKTEWVILEHDGPGAITRMWTPLLAERDAMLVNFYFDGASTPSVQAPFNDLLRGRSFAKPPFAFIAWEGGAADSGVGGDCYLPISWAKSCKVTTTLLPNYYAINYRAYEPGSEVETFTLKGLAKAKAKLDRTAEALNDRPSELAGPTEPKGRKTLGTNQELKLELPKGPAAICELAVDLPKDADGQIFRSVAVEISFDGEKTVWCPLGEFFGGGIYRKPVYDRYRSVSADGKLRCHWVMPYRDQATVRLVNYGAESVGLNARVATKPWKWDERSMLFHADWRSEYPIKTRPMSDWNYVTATGEGSYVGDTLTVMSPGSIWFGEGDEKVYVDGESFPSQLGTGTEDYYGYGWGMADGFSSPFLSMPRRDLPGRENWSGYTTTSRVRMLDQIPFRKSIRFDMEVWHWADCRVEYSAAMFYYAKPGAKTNREPLPKVAASPLPDWRLVVKGALECETMNVVRKSGGTSLEIQDGGLSDGGWSAGKQLFAKCARVGDYVEIEIPVSESGRRKVTLYATKSYDYGIIRFSVDGVKGQEVDLWSRQPVSSGPIELGEFDLKAGKAVLRAEVIDSNPKATGTGCFIGLDCIVLGK